MKQKIDNILSFAKGKPKEEKVIKIDVFINDDYLETVEFPIPKGYNINDFKNEKIVFELSNE